MIVCGAILPHSAVLVPEVGRGRERPAFNTIAALRRAARTLAASDFDTLLVLTPHGPRPPVGQALLAV
ncbi:MAG TPA: AMMECR1 domain-containing protein, partial [Dehalococcoidia bacterium]